MAIYSDQNLQLKGVTAWKMERMNFNALILIEIFKQRVRTAILSLPIAVVDLKNL